MLVVVVIVRAGLRWGGPEAYPPQKAPLYHGGRRWWPSQSPVFSTMADGGHRTTTFIVLGLAAVASAVTIYYLTSSRDDRKKRGGTASPGSTKTTTKSSRSSVSSERDAGSVDWGSTPTKSNVNSSSGGGSSSSSYFTASQTAATTRSKSSAASHHTGEDEEYRALHIKIEDIDREGKTLFKDKKFLEAAEKFTEALDLIDAKKLANATLEFSSPLTPLAAMVAQTIVVVLLARHHSIVK